MAAKVICGFIMRPGAFASRSDTVSHSVRSYPAVVNERPRRVFGVKYGLLARAGAEPGRTGRGAGRMAHKGMSILEKLAPSLQERGVPGSSSVVVNSTNGEFVKSTTREEASGGMHPCAKCCMQPSGEVSVEAGDCPMDTRLPDVSRSSRPNDPKPQIVRC
jgi:hypothetical protein